MKKLSLILTCILALCATLHAESYVATNLVMTGTTGAPNPNVEGTYYQVVVMVLWAMVGCVVKCFR